MQAGSYTLHLYCDNVVKDEAGNVVEYGLDGIHDFGQLPNEFFGDNRGDCVAQARRRGWLLKRDGRDFCPRCSGKVKA